MVTLSKWHFGHIDFDMANLKRGFLFNQEVDILTNQKLFWLGVYASRHLSV
jgi:hypothetical protein